MSGFFAVLWRDFIFFKQRFSSITLSSIVTPILYMITFGLGLGKAVNMGTVSYLEFLIPGIIAISAMNTSFTAIATPMIIARIHDKTLEEYLSAPISALSFMTGKVISGALRGVYACTIILIVAFLFGVRFKITPLFILIMLLNSLLFASMGFAASLFIKSHMDMARFRNFIMTPMVFICGTFFAVDSLPKYFAYFIKILPLTPATYGLRAISLGTSFPWWSVLIQSGYFLLFSIAGVRLYKNLD